MKRMIPIHFAAFAAVCLAATSALAEPPSSGVKPSDDTKKAIVAEETKEKETDKGKAVEKDPDKAKTEDKAKARTEAEIQARENQKETEKAALNKETVRENADAKPDAKPNAEANSRTTAPAADREAGARNQPSNAKADPNKRTDDGSNQVKPAEERPRDPQ